MTFPDAAALFALLATPGVGYVAAGQALTAARDANVPLAELLGLDGAESFDRVPNATQDARAAWARCEPDLLPGMLRQLERVHKAGGQAILLTDGDYPAGLKTALGRNAPPILCVAGDSALLSEEMGAVAGARDASPESIGYAADCARAFAEAGLPVVSGAARGVDEAAHRAALDAGGKSIFVLPRGLLTHRANRVFQGALEEGRALFLSEFLPSANWATHSAILRNATIAALARVVCVFEPRATGGTIRTADAGLAQGRPVLFHCAPDQHRVERRLRQSGATALPVHDARELRETLQAALSKFDEHRVEQQELC